MKAYMYGGGRDPTPNGPMGPNGQGVRSPGGASSGGRSPGGKNSPQNKAVREYLSPQKPPMSPKDYVMTSGSELDRSFEGTLEDRMKRDRRKARQARRHKIQEKKKREASMESSFGTYVGHHSLGTPSALPRALP